MTRLHRLSLLLLTACMLFLTPPPVQAGPYRHERLLAQEGSRPRRRRQLTRQVGLSEEQKHRMLDIQRRYHNNPDKKGMWREIRGVMTPEQMRRLRRARRGRQ